MPPLKPKATLETSTGPDASRQALALAKLTLKHLGELRLPPTPEMYEVFYRYVEGGHAALQERLTYLLDDVKAVNGEQIRQLHQQYFASPASHQTNVAVSQELSSEMNGLQSLLASQHTAGENFQASMLTTGEKLADSETSPEEVRRCIKALLASHKTMASQIRYMQSRLEESQRQVGRLREDLIDSQSKVLLDPLTGIGNRRYFDSVMSQAFKPGEPTELLCFLMLIDIDDFKHINDTFGHATGDEVLRFVSTELQRIVSHASIARYGGDEFAVFVRAESVQSVAQQAHQICEFFAKHQMKIEGTDQILGQLTVSIGVALLREDDDQASWFERGDKLLYTAKENGRNCVRLERDLHTTPASTVAS